jgi:ribonuclease HII
MLIAGVDEVGRGPLAGPVVAAAVVFESGYFNKEIKDSKKLSIKKREQLIEVIKKEAKSWAVVSVGHQRIKLLNIRNAAKLAMSLAIKRIKADLVLVDGDMEIISNIPQKTVIGGDNIHVEISAASILAKVWRDNLLVTLDNKYPGYNLGKHAGYPTKAHRQAIEALGPSPIHRVAFKGVKEFVKNKAQNSNATIFVSSAPSFS